MQIIIDVEKNPIHNAEGIDYFLPDLYTYISENMLEILKEKGKVLPKGHGRLIDADNLMELAYNCVTKTVDCNDIARFPTIIEADKEDT